MKNKKHEITTMVIVINGDKQTEQTNENLKTN